MEPALRFDERSRSRARCSICHDERGALRTCPGCGTAFHRDCRDELEQCPSLGCVAGQGPAEASKERGAPGQTVAAGSWPIGRLYCVPLGMALLAACALPNHPSNLQEFAFAVSGAYTAFFLLRTVLAHWRGERGRAWVVHLALTLSSPIWAMALGWLLLLVLPDPWRLRH